MAEETKKENQDEEAKEKLDKPVLEKLKLDEKGIIEAEISDEMKSAYIDYAMSVIVSRAIPAAEDGLKPVQRRILHSMNAMGLQPDKPTRKSARIVGDTMGKFHPHGDMAIYDALVRMAQDFSLRYPLISGQGNFGSIDNDPAAAMRYCVSGDSLIITENGLQKIEELSDNEDINIKIVSKDKRINNASKWFDSGEHETIKITTNKGYSLTGSKNHPVLTLTKDKCGKPVFMWKLLENMSEKDIVVIDRKEDNFWPQKEVNLEKYYPRIRNKQQKIRILPKTLNEEAGFILGLLISEGSITKNKIEFCNSDEKLIKEFKEKWNNLFPDSTLHQFKRKPSSYGKKDYFRLECHCRYTVEFLRSLGLQAVKAREKSIPKLVLSSPKTIAVSFLKAYFEGDGSISYSRKMNELSCCSASIKLIEEIQILLLRFGIDSFKRFDNYNNIHKLYLRGKRNILRFYKEINFSSERKKKKLEFVLLNYKKEASITDFVPFLSDFIRKHAGYSDSEFAIKHNFDRYENMSNNYQRIVSIIKQKEGIDYSSVFEYFLTYNYLFDYVTEIKNAGIQKVYSIKVESDCHSFISNGFISHNTEARLSKISTHLIEDLDKETVKFIPNFDNSEEEPEVMPGKLPNMLLNGAQGIAVGMTTNMPPHNLTDTTNAIIAYIENTEIKIEKLIDIIQGPDFPTGGQISRQGISDLYLNGKGSFIIKGKLTTEKIKSKDAIIMTELPYQVNKAELIKKIAELIKTKKFPDISDIRDESAKGKIRIVLELRRDANPQFTINRLMEYTNLQIQFDGIMLALVNGQPKVLNLKEIIKTYVDHRKTVVLKRTKYDLRIATDKQHLTDGLLIALKDVDFLINLIKKSENTTIAFENLQTKLKLSKRQAETILDMKLSKLTHLEQDKLKDENEKLKVLMKELQIIVDNPKEILDIIRKELMELRRLYGDSRNTTIFERVKEFTEKDLVAKKDVILTVTAKGYVKRMDIKAYQEQKRGGKGVIGAELATDDFVKQIITCNTHDYLLLFTSRGRLYWLKAYEVPEAARYGKGRPIVQLLNINDEITAVLPVKKFEGSLFMITQKGVIKRVNMKLFSNPRNGGVNAIKLNGDKLIDVEIVEGNEEIMMTTKEGIALRCKVQEVREMGRNAYGVTGIKLEKDDVVVGVQLIPQDEALRKKLTSLTVTENGFGKRTPIEDYRLTSRACKGVININTSERNGKVVGTELVNDEDSIIVTTAKGIVIRTSMKDLREMSRNTQGVKIIKLSSNDKVTSVAKVQKTIEGEEITE